MSAAPARPLLMAAGYLRPHLCHHNINIDIIGAQLFYSTVVEMGGGIGREAVLGGAVLGGTIVRHIQGCYCWPAL